MMFSVEYPAQRYKISSFFYAKIVQVKESKKFDKVSTYQNLISTITLSDWKKHFYSIYIQNIRQNPILFFENFTA